MEEAHTSQPHVLDCGKIREFTWWKDRGLFNFTAYVILLSVLFQGSLASLFRHAMKEELHSHILLIPVVVLYLAGLKRGLLSHARPVAMAGASVFAIAAAALFFGLDAVGTSGWSQNDQMSRSIGCYVLLLVAGGFMFLGSSWMRALGFPFCMLMLMVPMPDMMAAAFEDMLMRASAVTAEWIFQWTGTPVFRSGQVIELPGMTLEVARECSGIRSTLVLFITSLIASHLFLSSSWHRILLVALVIPLGIVRNAVRVFVIGFLCIHRGPQMIDSWIHHHGGPVFFLVTLVPLLAFAAWFRRREMHSGVG